MPGTAEAGGLPAESWARRAWSAAILARVSLGRPGVSKSHLTKEELNQLSATPINSAKLYIRQGSSIFAKVFAFWASVEGQVMATPLPSVLQLVTTRDIPFDPHCTAKCIYVVGLNPKQFRIAIPQGTKMRFALVCSFCWEFALVLRKFSYEQICVNPHKMHKLSNPACSL